MKKSEWINHMNTQEDVEKHAEKLLRRMKRDYTFGVSVGNGYLMSGYRTYILNDDFITKEEAKKRLVKEINDVMESLVAKKEIEYERKEDWYIIKSNIEAEYTTIVDFDNYSMEYRICGKVPEDQCKNWRIFETKIQYGRRGSRKEIGGLWNKYESLEECKKIVQDKYDKYHEEMITSLN